MAISRKRKQRAQPAPAVAQAQQRAIDQTFLPIAIGQILASLEALAIKKLYKDDGLLRGVSSIGQPAEGVAGKVRLMIDSPHTPRILATVTLVASGTLLMGRGRRRTQIAASAVIAIANRVNEFRTPYGRDGADQMTGIITQYRTLSALVPNRELSDDLFLRALNIQAGLSYFVSGISKLFGSSWVQGDAIGEILQTEAYGRGPAASVLRRFPRVVRLLTWVTPLWEVGFPIVYSLPSRWANIALVAVKGFHVGVATVMELPRFVWGFAGSHGAVQYVVDQRRRGHRSLGNLERSVLTTAGVAVSVSVAYAASQRELDIVRRRGLKGTKVLDVGDGLVEYDLRTPTDSSIAAGEAPIIILEAGLGSPLASFSWLAEMLSEKHHVLSYHRSGYGLTTSKKSPGELVSELLGRVDSTGKLISVSHSIGSLVAATYCASDLGGRRIEAIVIVDGTDPGVLAQDRADRRRRGAFLQAQLGSMFVALSGVYNFVPNAISRQSAYAPDDQMGVIQFSFSPGNILRATRDYFAIPTADAIQALKMVGRRKVIASKEYEKQEISLASSLDAPFTLIENSSHRSILGYRAYAQRVADIIREAV